MTLELAVDRLAELERLLSPDEVARADRFAFPTLRARFVAARGQLREILGREQGLPPGSVPIATGRWGKPYVAASDAVRFNLSHSADRAVCATSSGRDVGIDIEQVPWHGDELGVGRLVFAPAELDALIGKKDYVAFLNPRNELYRERNMKERPPSREAALKLMAETPNLIRRPLLFVGDDVLYGFDEKAWSQALAR